MTSMCFDCCDWVSGFFTRRKVNIGVGGPICWSSRFQEATGNEIIQADVHANDIADSSKNFF